MKRVLLFSVLSTLILLYSGCKKENDKPVEESLTLIDEQLIGPAGGVLGSLETVKLEVPAGAFGTSQQLALYSSDGKNPFEESGGAVLYYIEGLPDNFQKELRLIMPYTGTADDGNYIVKGRPSVSTTEFDTVYAAEFLETNDSAGFLIGTIPIGQNMTRENTGSARAGSKHIIQVTYAAGYLEALTEHFRIRYPKKYYGDNSINMIADGLEEAYDLLKSWGFSYEKRTKWPLEVVIKFLKSNEIYGQSTRSFPYTANYGIIEINRMNLNDIPRAKITAAHEFFHVVQDFYNYDDKYDWLQEASSVWFEKFFSSDPAGYVPDVFSSNLMQPFIGLQYGSKEGVNNHGYGCAAVIKYLMEINNASNNPAAIHDIWQATTTGDHPVAILLNFQSDFPDWWNDFMFNYYGNDIYPNISNWFSESYFKERKDFIFPVKGSGDTKKEFYNVAYDLSGQVYKIDLDWSGLTEKTQCKISLTEATSYLYIYRYKVNDIVLLGEVSPGKSAKILDLKSYYDNGYDFVLLLSNYGADPSISYQNFNPVRVIVDIVQEEVPVLTFYETQADNIAPYFSGSFSITIETDNQYPFTIDYDGYFNPNPTDKTKDLDICFDPPPAGQEVVFHIYVDTLDLVSSNGAKTHIMESNWQLGDLTQNPYLLHPAPNDLPYHLVVRYNNTISAGFCSFWLELETQNPYLNNTLSVMSLDFNTSCGKGGKDYGEEPKSAR